MIKLRSMLGLEVLEALDPVGKEDADIDNDGDVEKWTAPDKKKILKRIERDYKKLKENLLAQVEEPKNDTTT